jgi:hypothetical protein
MASILAFRSDIFPSLWPFVGRAGLGARFFCRHLFFFEETLPAIICQENSHLHKKLADAALVSNDTNTEINKLFKISEETSDICSKSNIVIQNNIANIKQGETKICDDDYNMGF